MNAPVDDLDTAFCTLAALVSLTHSTLSDAMWDPKGNESDELVVRKHDAREILALLQSAIVFAEVVKERSRR